MSLGRVVFFGWEKCRVIGGMGVKLVREENVASGHKFLRENVKKLDTMLDSDKITIFGNRTILENKDYLSSQLLILQVQVILQNELQLANKSSHQKPKFLEI